MMAFSLSLKKNRDFQKVYKNKCSRADEFLVLYTRKNGLEINRLGISASKKVGNSVVRHKIKRLVKEAYRLEEASFLAGYDMVVVARKEAASMDFFQCKSSLLRLAGKMGIRNKDRKQA